MIVICTKCQAKFRVADEKIGPRGAKVRCSKCRTVFLVHPDLGTMPVTDGDARPAAAKAIAAPPPAGGPPSGPAPTFDPFGDADPFAAPAPAAAAPDPFAAAASADPFAIPASAADPFPAPAQDPFGAPPPAPLASAARPDPFGEADPFAVQSAPAARPGLDADADDPFAAAASPRSTLPVTDLSDLLGGGAREALPSEPAGDPGPEPFAVSPLSPDLLRPAELGRGGGFASADAFGDASPPAPDLAAPGLGAPDDGGLALEDRLTPPPAHIHPPPPPVEESLETADASPAAPPPDPFAAFIPPLVAGGPAEPYFDAATFAAAPTDHRGSLELDSAPPPAPPARPAAARTEPAHAALAPAPAAVPAAERIPGARTSRLRTVAVNAVALVALLVVALTLWALWRTEGPLEAASFHPSAILAALGRGDARAGPWAARDVRSGFYDRERAAPVLFVRGRVVSRAPSAVAAVRVAVEVVRDGQVLARGEAIAGAIPTAEELYGAGDDAALSAAVRAARVRAPARIRPGDAVPFLVAIGGASTELEGATLRIDVAPAPGGAP